MASESREEQPVTVEIPADLDEWLGERATRLGLDREEVLVQLLASYRAAASLDDESVELGEIDPATVVDEVFDGDVTDRVDAAAAEAVDAAAKEAVDEAAKEAVDAAAEAAANEAVEDAIERHLADAIEDRLADAVEDVVAERVASVESEFQAKIEDVRERVIQVKREADSKAAADHDHEALDRAVADLDELAGTVADHRASVEDRLAAVDEQVEAIESDLEALEDEQETALEDVRGRLSDAEDKLQRVAWVVSDLRDEVGGRDAHERAVDRLKRAAAQEGVESAECEICGESVQISLLTQPECPHCDTVVSDVRLAGGLLRKKARLVPAAQLESGEQS